MPHGENLDIVLPKVQEPRDTWLSGPDGKAGQLVDAAMPRPYQPVLDRPLAAGWL